MHQNYDAKGTGNLVTKAIWKFRERTPIPVCKGKLLNKPYPEDKPPNLLRKSRAQVHSSQALKPCSMLPNSTKKTPQNIIRLGLLTHARKRKLPSGIDMFNHVAPMHAGQHVWSPNMIPICVSQYCLLIQKALHHSAHEKQTHKHTNIHISRYKYANKYPCFTLVIGHRMNPPSVHPLHWPSGCGIPAVL